MQKIVPFIWFDTQAQEAIELYTSIFSNSSIQITTRYGDGMPQPKGSVMTVNFSLENQNFIALNGGPYFKLNPSISFFVTLESEKEVDTLWEKLSADAEVLMPFQSYDWSPKYGWLTDKFGISWQISLSKRNANENVITPSLLFVGEQFAKAKEAINLYTSLFEGSNITSMMQNGDSVQHAQFKLAAQNFIAMDSDFDHKFSFNEAISFFVNCEDQKEVDHFWDALSAYPESERCGWLKDKFGVSWQIIPKALMELMSAPDREKAARVTKAMLAMKKIDVVELERAFAST